MFAITYQLLWEVYMLNIVTIKWGNRYSSRMVNELFESCLQYCKEDFLFHCFTDNSDGLHDEIVTHNLPEIELPAQHKWSLMRKLSLFGDNLPLEGKCLYMDIDVIIVGTMEPLLNGFTGRPRFIKSFVGEKTKRKSCYDKINSSVVLFQANKHKKVLDTFYADRENIISKYPGDQGFLYDCLEDEAEFFADGLCVSFKKHCIPKFPLNYLFKASPPKSSIIVLFHGKPDPSDARRGWYKGPYKKHCLPINW